MPPAKDEGRAALIAGLGCYTMWGLFPIYMHALGAAGVSPLEITAERTAWALLWAAALVLAARKTTELKRVLSEPRTLGLLLGSSLLIGINWLLYVIAVNSGRTLEASLGYYINPLMNMAAGALFFRERLDRIGLAAIALAAIGVAVQTAAVGHPPLLSLGLAVSFCGYGLIRKQVNADAQTGLFVETAILAVPAIAYVVWLQKTGVGHFGDGVWTTILLLCAGPLTVAPLALFAWAARRMPLVALGFLQFIAPTLQFFVGVASGEAFTPMRALAFGFIWIGAAVFAFGAWIRYRRLAAHTVLG
ncbi:MAG: EamA family transporter RarD [Caulobacter sp.]|nr:EamA family transporter RarD [Caulobacter sp.]